MAPKYILEQFLQQELLINITEHEVRKEGFLCVLGTLVGPGRSALRGTKYALFSFSWQKLFLWLFAWKSFHVHSRNLAISTLCFHSFLSFCHYSWFQNMLWWPKRRWQNYWPDSIFFPLYLLFWVSSSVFCLFWVRLLFFFQISDRGWIF